MLVPFVLLLLVVAVLIVEAVVTRRHIDSIGLRIHVNGTRGKSSVTRYVAAGLRAAGKRVWAKTTGTKPTLIHADGGSSLIKRRGGARVQEQFQIAFRAARHNADALVLECMSLQPELQELEGRTLRPHIYVLTNVKDDHREVFGSDPADQADALCSPIVAGSKILTTDGYHVPFVRKHSAGSGNPIDIVKPLSAEQAARVPSGVFHENVVLALSVCAECGVAPDIAFPAIIAEELRQVRALVTIDEERHLYFVDGFAVNDVPSATDFIEYWCGELPEVNRLAVVFNSRPDRPLRSSVFSEWLPGLSDLTAVFLVGHHASYMRRALKRHGLDNAPVVTLSHSEIKDVKNIIAGNCSTDTLVVGLGNIGGDGFEIAETLRGGTEHAV